MALLKEKEFVYMRADLTTPVPEASALIEALGGQGLPFLAIFPGDKPNEPRVLTDFNVFNPWSYRSRLFKILDECPGPATKQIAERHSSPSAN